MAVIKLFVRSVSACASPVGCLVDVRASGQVVPTAEVVKTCAP